MRFTKTKLLNYTQKKLKFTSTQLILSDLTGMGRDFEQLSDKSSELRLSSSNGSPSLVWLGTNNHSLCSLNYDWPCWLLWRFAACLVKRVVFLKQTNAAKNANCYNYYITTLKITWRPEGPFSPPQELERSPHRPGAKLSSIYINKSKPSAKFIKVRRASGFSRSGHLISQRLQLSAGARKGPRSGLLF